MDKQKKKNEIYIRCFGKLAIYANGQELSAQMNSLKARELIAFLLTYQGETVKKSTVCAALWEDKSIEAAMDNLYKLLKKISLMPIPFKIRCSRGMIQLCLDNIECDLLQFEQLILDRENVENKELAVQLYQGTLFAEEDYSWVEMKEGIYDNKYFEMLDFLYEYYDSVGNIRKSRFYGRLMEEYD